MGFPFKFQVWGLVSQEEESASLLFLCLPHRAGGGILEPQTNTFLPWMTLLSGNYHSLEIMWRKHFSSQNRKRGICEVQKFSSKYVWASVVRKRDVLQSEIARQLKLKYQNFIILTLTGKNWSKPYYFPAMSEYICISYNLLRMTLVKCTVMYQCHPRGPLRLYRDLT